MSEEEIEIHAAHEHALEHEAHAGNDLARQIAVFTALLAASGAIVGYLGGHNLNEALIFKNQAVLMKAHASDQWAFYQAKSTKAHLMEMAATLGPEDKRAGFKQESDRYELEKKDIKKKAEEFEEKSRQADEESEKAMLPHTRLAQAMSAIQIAIALASVTALTRQRWLIAPALGAAAIGLGLVAWAYL